MDLTFQIPMQYGPLQCQTYFHHQTYSQLSIFQLCSSNFIIYGAIRIALCFSPVTFWTTFSLGCLSVSILLHFYTVLGIFVARILEWFAIPASSGSHFFPKFSTMTSPSWLALHGIAQSFIELCTTLCHEKAVIH